MTDITIHTEAEHQTTGVSNAFIDDYRPNANGDFVKIYLYLLRVLSQENAHFSISQMADKLHYTENDIRRGLAYWEQLHLLRLEYDNDARLISVCLLTPQRFSHRADAVSHPAILEAVSNHDVPVAAITAAEQIAYTVVAEPKDTPQTNPATSTGSTPQYSAMDIASFKEQENVSELLFISEHYIGHTLNMTEINKIFFWYDQLHFSVDMIEYLVEYCVEKGHPNIHYMNKVALNWAESGIATVEEAKQSANIHSQSYYAVMKAFGISGRNLLDAEIAYIRKWTGTYGFTLDIITEACARTIRNTGKAKFEYADSILTSWHKQGIRHLEDIARLDEAFASNKPAKTTNKPAARTTNNRFHNFEQRSYDDDYYIALEQQLLRK